MCLRRKRAAVVKWSRSAPPHHRCRVSPVCAFFICCPTLLRTSQALRLPPPVLLGDEAILIPSGSTDKLVAFPGRTVAAERGRSDTLTSVCTATEDGSQTLLHTPPPPPPPRPALQRHSECKRFMFTRLCTFLTIIDYTGSHALNCHSHWWRCFALYICRFCFVLPPLVCEVLRYVHCLYDDVASRLRVVSGLLHAEHRIDF